MKIAAFVLSLSLVGVLSSEILEATVAPKILVHGHRGARARRPENTLAAFKYALDSNADVLEMDLAVTSDDILVISHDGYIDKDICQLKSGERAKSVPIRSLSFSQIKNYDCGTKRNPRFPTQETVAGEKIPSLAEVFDWIKSSKNPRAKTVQFNIEMKIDPDHPDKPDYNLAPAPFAKLLVDAIHKYKMENRVIVQCFVPQGLIEMKKIAPKIRRSMLIQRNEKRYLEMIEMTGANILSPEYGFLTKGRVEELHKKGIQVAPWTVNAPDDWKSLIQMQVNAIITDDPASLVAYLAQHPEF